MKTLLFVCVCAISLWFVIEVSGEPEDDDRPLSEATEECITCHAEVTPGKGRQQASAQILAIGGADHADVVEANGSLKEFRIVGNHRTSLTRRDRLAELEAIDADVPNGADVLTLVASP